MEEIKIDLSGCSSDAIVKSTLATLQVFHEEIISLREHLIQSEGKIEALELQLNKQVQANSTKETEVKNLKKQEAISSEKVKRLTEEIKELQESHQREIQEIVTKNHKDSEESNASYDKTLETLKSNHEKELNASKTQSQKEIEDLNTSLEEVKREREDWQSECELLSKGLLSIFDRLAKGLSAKIKSLICVVESESLKIWIGGILDKGAGSELKGLDAFDEIKSLDLLKRNVVFQNSLFSEIATLLMWSSNEELRHKLAPSFDWSSLSKLFKEFVNLLSEIGISVSIPENMGDREWLSNASNVADQTEQRRFTEFFGKDIALERGAPIFITSVSGEERNGSYIRYYK